MGFVAFEDGKDFGGWAEAGFVGIEDVGVAVDSGEGKFFHLEGVDLAVEEFVTGTEKAAGNRK